MANTRANTGLSDDLITCSICIERFKSPKSLPCLHTYCKGCLHTYIAKALAENKPKVECPTCRSAVRDFAGEDVNQWVDSLPTNFIVNSLIEREEMQNGKRNCDFCLHLGKSISATMWCQECSEAYCEDCSQRHHFHKMFRKHALIQIKDAMKSMYFAAVENSFDCPVHKNRKIELYCFDHAEPCCLTCMTVHHRKCDKVTTLEEAAENFKEDPIFVSFTKRINYLTSEMREEVACLNEKKKKYSSELSQIREKAKTKKEDAVRHIEILYKKIEEDITSAEKRQNVDDQSEILTQKIIQLELLTKTLESMKKTSSDLSLFLEFHKMKGKEKYFDEFLEKYKSIKKQESVELTCRKIVTNLDSAISCFGENHVVDSLTQASRSANPDYTSSALKQVVTIEEEGTRFMDAVCIPTDTIFAVDDKQKTIWAYDDTGVLLTKSDLLSNPWSLVVVDTNKIVVTLRQHKSLQFLTYENRSKTFSTGKTINLNEQPYGVEYAGNCLYVTFAQKVKKLTLDGGIINELLIPQSSLMTGISFFNGNIIVTDEKEPIYSIHGISMESNPIVKYQKKYSNLKHPSGVTTDPDGNVYVVGYSTNNVIQLSHSGEVVREILPRSSGFTHPIGVNISYDGLKLILTHENKITLFEIQ